MNKVGRYGELAQKLIKDSIQERETNAQCLDRLLRELLELRNRPTAFMEKIPPAKSDAVTLESPKYEAVTDGDAIYQ